MRCLFRLSIPACLLMCHPTGAPGPLQGAGRGGEQPVASTALAAATAESTPPDREAKTRTRISFRQTGDRHYDCGRQPQGDRDGATGRIQGTLL